MKSCAVLLVLGCMLSAASGQMTWSCATDSAGWSRRYGYASVVFDGRMWVIGGGGRSLECDEVWYSGDGVSWTRATDSAGWGWRCCYTAVVFDGRMWMVGGDYPFPRDWYCHDVWYSSDGANWTQATDSASCLRSLHTSVVFDDKMWVIGGGGMLGCYLYDVWNSSDGVHWLQATDSAGWTARGGHTSVVFDNKMWVIGGRDLDSTFSDVWYSSDGISWTQATDSAGWSPRWDHTSVVLDGKMWVVGGYSDAGQLDDVWYSADGVDWILATDSAGWPARGLHTSVVFDDRMWVLGGLSIFPGADTSRGDVWHSTGLGIAETPKTELRTTHLPTVVHGNLHLPPDPEHSTPSALLDITGRRVADLVPGPNDVRHLAPGIYFVRAVGPEPSAVGCQKVIVTR